MVTLRSLLHALWKKLTGHAPVKKLGEETIERAFQKLGTNWDAASSAREVKPLLIFFGLSPAQREPVAVRLPQYRCAFAFGKTPASRQLAFLKKYPPQRVCAAVHCGRASVAAPIATYLANAGIPLSLYQDLEEFLEDLQEVYLDEGKAFAGVALCGNTWTSQNAIPIRNLLLIGIPSCLRPRMTCLYAPYRCAFIANALDEDADLDAFLSLYPPEKTLIWSPESLDPLLKEFLAARGLTVEPTPRDRMLRSMFIPCGEQQGKEISLDNDDLPLAVIWGLERAAEARLAPCLPQYRLVRFAPAMTLDLLESLHDELVFLFYASWQNENVEAFARRQHFPVFYVNEAILSRLGWRKTFPVPLFMRLSSVAPDPLGLPKRLELTDATRERLKHMDGQALIRRLMELRRLARSGDGRVDGSSTRIRTDTFTLAVWHEEETPVIGLDTFLEQVARERSAGDILCLCLKAGRAENRSAELGGVLHHRCVFLEHAEEFDAVCPLADSVYVVGSLYGLEALLYGCRVVTCGTPFYAGLGLTRDLTPQEPREPMTLEELTVSTLFSEPCLAPYSGEELESYQALALHHLRERADFSYIFETLQDELGIDERHLFLEMRVKLYHGDTEMTVWLEHSLRGFVFGAVLADLLSFRAECPELGALLYRLPTQAAFLLLQALLIYAKTNLLYDLYADVIRQYVRWFEEHRFRDVDTLAFYEQYFKAYIANRFRELGPLPKFRTPNEENSATFLQTAEVYSRILLRSCHYDLFEEFFVCLPPMAPEYYLKVLRELMTDPFAYREPSMEKRLELRLGMFHAFVSIMATLNLPPLGGEMVALTEAWLREDLAAVDTLAAAVAASVEGGAPAPTGQAVSLLKMMVETFMQGMNYQQVESVLGLLEQAEGAQSCAGRRRHLRQMASTVFPGGMTSEQRNREMEKNLLSLQASRRRQTTLDGIWKVSRNYALEKFYQETSRLMARTSQPAHPEGYIFLHHFGMHQTSILPLVVNGLAARNIATIPLSTGFVSLPSRGVSGLHRFAYSLPYGNGRLSLDWHVDFVNREISALGINFFNRFDELLSVSLRRYDIDWEAPITQRFFNRFLQTSDVHLHCCHEIYKEVRRTDAKAGVLLDFPYVPPQAVWLDYAMHVNDPAFRLIYYCTGHIRPLALGPAREETTVAAVDMTLHTECRVPFFPPREKFQTWYRHFRSTTGSDMELERVRQSLECPAPVDFPIFQRLQEEKVRGKRIVCCYGRLLYDRSLRKDGGPGHANMMDWLLHSIDVAAGTPEMLLLIKPHPDEDDSSYSCGPLQQLRDVLPDPLPDNVICLPATGIKTPHLNGLIDLAALWLGTATYELTALGVPVAVCSHDGLGETPFRVLSPAGREEYADMLRGQNCPAPTKEQMDQAAAYIKYLRMDDVVKPYPYSFVSFSNDFTAVPYYHQGFVEKYFKEGDPYIEQVIDQIMEGFVESRN